MESKNYFKILDLDFDPPEKNQKKIDKAIQTWKKRTEDILANETDKVRRATLLAELDMYEDMVNVLKDNKERNREAHELKEFRIGQLEKLIDIMLTGQSGTPRVTNAQIRNVHLKLRLSPKTIEDIYKKKGFMVQQKSCIVNLNDAFLSTVVAGNISTKLEQLRTLSSPKYPWSPNVYDLYDLAGFFSEGVTADIVRYHKKRTTELYSIMETWATQLASDMSSQGHLLADLFTAGITQVFNSETNRKKYDQSLEREKLKGFFALLRTAPDDFKKDRYFADSCIRIIQKNFPDFNLSLALYNQEAGLMHDPYEPLEALIHVTCGTCKTPSEFRTHEEAEKGKCAVCGAPLYIECPQCHKKVPASADRCSCNFLISEIHFFEDYLQSALFALREMDLTEAEKQLANAERAYPGHPQLISVKQKIKKETERYQKPLNDLQRLISDGMFSQANVLLNSISSSMPQLKLDSQRNIINKKLSEAQKRIPDSNLNATTRANRCVEILDVVKDFQPAIDILTMLRPGKPLNLHASVNNSPPLVCTLSWNAAGDKGVTYCIVRKNGGIPQTHTDGDVLKADVKALEYRDSSLQPGISYGYAVFAGRRKVYSEAATCVVENFSELDIKQVQWFTESGICRFSWVLPANCIGVRILRCINSIPAEAPDEGCVVIAARATAHYEDNSVSNDVTYGYRLQCVYPYEGGFRYSVGITQMLTPEQPPVALKNISVRNEGCHVTVRWSCSDSGQCSVLIREVPAEATSRLIGKIIPASDINSFIGNGRSYVDMESSLSQAQFEIPPDTACSLAIISIKGSKGIISDIVKVSSVEKCEIDKRETGIDGNRLRIVIANKPTNLECLHYIVAEKKGNKAPWAEIQDAKRNSLSKISFHDYNRDGMILVEQPPKTELYISVIGQYKMSDGSTVYSEPSKMRISNKPKEEITYKLLWTSGGFFHKQKIRSCKLIIHSNAKETPELKVIYLSDGHIPMRINDPKAVVLHTVPESDRGFENGEYVFEFSDSTWSSVRSGTAIRVFLTENDMAEYTVTPIDLSTLTVP